MSFAKLPEKPLFVANWKMYKNYHETCAWFTDNATELAELAHHAHLIICPTFPTLSFATQKCIEAQISLGAQECSAHTTGPFTGQVNAQTLYQVGCTYCIIGHSERRRELHETSDTVAQKAALLLAHEITPIVCIGEQQAPTTQEAVINELELQLHPLARINEQRFVNQRLCIAYEPAWAIGSNTVPSSDHLRTVFTFLRSYCTQAFPLFNLAFLYGGSVSMSTITPLTQVPGIDGFLVGSAALDFQNFKNIVLSSSIRVTE